MTHSKVGQSSQNKTTKKKKKKKKYIYIEGHKNSLGLVIYQKYVTVAVLEKSV